MATELAHIQDAAWLIALWKAIRGGDPPPVDQKVAVAIGEGMVRYLGGQAETTVAVGELEKRFKAIGVTFTAAEVPAAGGSGAVTRDLTIQHGTQVIRLCFGVGAARQCLDVTIPKVAVVESR